MSTLGHTTAVNDQCIVFGVEEVDLDGIYARCSHQQAVRSRCRITREFE
jgi:hypothetical protein